MRIFQIVFIFLGALANPLWADATSDAKYIVDQTVNETLFIGALVAFKPVIASAIENDLRKQGITISDLATFADIIFEEFMDEFVVEMQSVTVEHYLANFSADELADIAEFYASPTGQVLIQRTPALMALGAKQGARIGELAGRNAGPRVAARLEAGGISITTDKSMMQKLIDALRR